MATVGTSAAMPDRGADQAPSICLSRFKNAPYNRTPTMQSSFNHATPQYCNNDDRESKRSR